MNKLMFLRKQRGLTQKQVAEIFEVSTPYYSMCESGRRTPSQELLAKMSVFFNTSIAELFGPVSDRTIKSMADYDDGLPAQLLIDLISSPPENVRQAWDFLKYLNDKEKN